MTQVKICGITNEADLLAVIEAGADMVGFMLYDKSPRAVTPEFVARCRQIMREIDAPRVPHAIGVFVDPQPDEYAHALTTATLPAAQLHRVADMAKLRELRHVGGACDYPAIQPATLADGNAAVDALRAENLLGLLPWQPDLMVDAFHPDLAGGTGKRVDLDLARALNTRAERMMLAGGLTPENVGDVVRAVRPFAVDVSSGVESTPGKKDHAKIRAFVQAVRAVS
jgi:phosphoribosylanthranilate isomerase